MIALAQDKEGHKLGKWLFTITCTVHIVPLLL